MNQPGKRLFLINRDFQCRYTRIAIIIGIASTVLTMGTVLFPLVQFQIIRFPNFVPTPFLAAIGVAALLNIVFIGFLGVLITHRIAGPMFAVVRHIHMVRAGRFVPPLKVRDRDDLRYLVRNYNELIEHLRELAVKDKSRLDATVASLKSGQAAEALATVEAMSAELATRLE